MTHSSPSIWAWLFSSQRDFSWCYGLEVRLDSISNAGPVCLWEELLVGRASQCSMYSLVLLVCSLPLGTTANSQDGARLDIAANGFLGGTFQRTYLDVNVFNRLASSNSQTSHSSCFKKHEWEKWHEYGQTIQDMEPSTFTPLVLSATGGMANKASIFYKRLASLLAAKWNDSYSSTLCWLRCRLAFSLLCFFIQVIRGDRPGGMPFDSPWWLILLIRNQTLPSLFNTVIFAFALFCFAFPCFCLVVFYQLCFSQFTHLLLVLYLPGIV